ncbi:MAG TPA: glycosyl hydrolase family 28-related protein [Verrucomicrobiae bacterium]|mgnify:CR=1 FL=1|nr:glycosyl hydrolase family 28-related protein [Verrucomicrobiae bacterium]
MSDKFAPVLLFAAVMIAGGEPVAPPWSPEYKIRPSDKQRLTAADVVGPDGIVYPNWTQCGVPGGIPRVADARRIEDFGARANDDLDDAGALDKACQSVGENGGGAVVLGAGTYHLDRPVTIGHDNVVIRGKGADRTKVIFRYAIPPSGAAFYGMRDGDRVGAGAVIELHCRPTGLMAMQIHIDGKPVHAWERSTHSGNTFATRVPWGTLAKFPDGRHQLRGVGRYKDGSECAATIGVTLDRSLKAAAPPYSQAAICFRGAGEQGPRIKLAADARRGSSELVLSSASGIAAGDRILIEGPVSDRWRALTRNKCPHGTYRRYQVAVERVDGDTITLGQPLRLEFPVADGSFAQKILPIRRCGIEDLYIEQTENLWITTVLFSNAWECWARGVRVRMCGRHPVYAGGAKWCEIRDCVFDDAWFKGGGGTAYGGWENACDCLMENIETFKLRHAPLVQWAASGCVIRKGVFHDSDAQWHSGWTNENLFEQCAVTVTKGNGAYGYGAWGSPPEDTAHGPNGPRNVVYNCDFNSPKAGLWMGGMNEGWIIAYNRFVVGEGPGVFMKDCSFDHILSANVFVLKGGASPMVEIKTADCVGVELRGNLLYGGNRKFVGGGGQLAVEDDNQARASGSPDRPAPAVPSIYEWQQALSQKIRR